MKAPKLTHEPCVECGERCESQLEFVKYNNGMPWPHCSGCDPHMKADEEFAEKISKILNPNSTRSVVPWRDTMKQEYKDALEQWSIAAREMVNAATKMEAGHDQLVFASRLAYVADLIKASAEHIAGSIDASEAHRVAGLEIARGYADGAVAVAEKA